ncbi:MAG TPA: hypothetical protein VF950_16180 [Planctomycetota bacterium]
MTWLYAALVAFTQEPSADDLKKEVERLRKQVETLEQQSVDDARTIKSLKGALRAFEENAPAAKAPAGSPAKAADGPAPLTPIKGKVHFVDPVNGFVAISCGKAEKVEVGYKFEIFRETFEGGSDTPIQTRLGVGEVDKFLGTGSTSKLRITEGDIKEMKLDDIAVAIRKLPAQGPAPAAAPEGPRTGGYRITGRAGTGYMIDFGQAQGAVQTALVFAVKEGVVKAKLRLDRVDKAYSVANIVPGSQPPGVPPPDQGDEILLSEPNKQLSGKVAYLDSKTQLVAVDLRQHDGVKIGQRFGLHRLGKQVGTVEITEIHPWGSWAKCDGETKHDEIQRGDIIRILEEKK